MGEDMRMKVILGKPNQLPHESLNGVSRRKVSRRAVREEGGSREAAVPAASITCVTSHRHTCTLGSPAQQVYVQENGSWKEPQEQLLRYQLAGRDQQLLLCSDLGQERQTLQDQSRLGKDSGSTRLSQENKAPCGATETFCLHSVHPEAIHEQLWSRGVWAFGLKVRMFKIFLEDEQGRCGLTCLGTKKGEYALWIVIFQL